MAGLGGRSVLVTGAGRGIGLGLVQHLLREPDPPRWVFAGCLEFEGEQGKELRTLHAKHQNLVVVRLDVTRPTDIKESLTCVEKYLDGTGLNLLINNAAILTDGDLEVVSVEDMVSVYQTNVIGPLSLCQVFLPLLKKAAQESSEEGLSCKKAAIINISTSLGSIELVPETYKETLISYRCSKAALNMLTRCQSVGYKEDGILCAAIEPGSVKTDMGTEAAELTVEESVRGIFDVISKLGTEDCGTFVNWKGEKVPW